MSNLPFHVALVLAVFALGGVALAQESKSAEKAKAAAKAEKAAVEWKAREVADRDAKDRQASLDDVRRELKELAGRLRALEERLDRAAARPEIALRKSELPKFESPERAALKAWVKTPAPLKPGAPLAKLAKPQPPEKEMMVPLSKLPPDLQEKVLAALKAGEKPKAKDDHKDKSKEKKNNSEKEEEDDNDDNDDKK